MNTLNYIGCKNTLFKTLLHVCNENIDGMEDKSFLDLFAGTGVVGFNMAFYFRTCSANDIEFYSYVINYALLICDYDNNLQIIIDKCNKLEGIEGLIFNNFSPNNSCERMFFTNENAKKADAIRNYIEDLYSLSQITKNEYYFLLASLIVSIDKIANTSCVYGSYLKTFKTTALKNLVLMPIHKNWVVNISNKVYNLQAEIFGGPSADYYDVVYMDPPYNHRQYSANYSPLNYIAHYDKDIILNGKTALIANYNKSNFCKKGEVKKTFTDLIEGIKCKYLIISYNNEGLMPIEEFKNILIRKGKVKLYKIQYNKFKAHKGVDQKYVEEYIWFINTSIISTEITEIELELIK
jgi:adenine-specific DNA-methyltransferase